MAGMLPGVELARRRRVHHYSSNQLDFDRHCRSDSLFRERLPPSVVENTISTMDSSTLMARMRLEAKLGGLRSRRDTIPQPQPQPPPVQARSSSHVHRPSKIHTGEKVTTEKEISRSTLTPQLSRRNSQREVCSVCLDDLLQGQREVTNLPCSHRYHSDCLLPWLASHSHCPYCRALVHL